MPGQKSDICRIEAPKKLITNTTPTAALLKKVVNYVQKSSGSTEGGLKIPSTNTEMLEAAKRYTAAGLIIHPLRKPVNGDKKTGKAPIEKDWSSRKEPRSEADLMRFWGKTTENPYNIGLLCGEKSGVTTLDIDDYNPAIINDLTKGIEKDSLVMSRRTPDRGHFYFKYTSELQSVKKHFIGFEVLNNGSNAVLPPSNHYTGAVYKINKKVTSLNDFPEISEATITRIKKLIEDSDKLENALGKCRPCLKRRFEEHQEKKNVKDWHGSTGRDITLALMIELYANGAGKDGLTLACKMLFRDDYNATTTEKEINYVIEYAESQGGKPWACETIRGKCGIITLDGDGGDLCDECKHRNQENKTEKLKKPGDGKHPQRHRDVLEQAYTIMLAMDGDQSRKRNGIGFNKIDSEEIHKDFDGKTEFSDDILIKHSHRLKKYKKQLIEFGIDGDELEAVIDAYKMKSKTNEPEKVVVHFDEVADKILEDNHIFSMRDNGVIYLYKDGVYRSDGVEAILGTKARDVYRSMFIKKWNEINEGFSLPDHIPKATAKYVAEVLAYIRAYTHIDRYEIDCEQDRYVNFKNGLFDLAEWQLKPHTPDTRSITQIPVVYNIDAECRGIKRYFNDCELPTESVRVLEEFAGYCLTTDVKLQKAVMLYGKGANGKSVFINMLKIILGKDSVSGESLQNLEIDKYRVANLYGKRLNAFPDLKDTPLQTNEVFNVLTGNDLELTGERKYQHDFSFKPTVKLLFSANKIPFAYSDNYAYYRRWILIEFPKTFEKDEIDENILEKMTTEEEKSGFLNLMLAGLKRLLENRKFSYNLGVKEIEKQYMLHSDNVTVFEEMCLRDCEGQEVPNEKKDVYDFYLSWCRLNKLTPVKPKTFTKKLANIGRKVYNTSKYNPDTGKSVWFSCYFNTRLTININPPKKPDETTQTNIYERVTEDPTEDIIKIE